MKKTMAIGLAVLIGVYILNGCIGQDDSESTVTVRRVQNPENPSQTPENPPQTSQTPDNPTQTPENPENPPQTSQTPENPQTPPENPQNPPQTPPNPGNPPENPGNPPQTPPPWNLEEPTPEEEEDARRIALEDESVQDLINGENYELEVTGCGLFPDGEKRCMLLLELENGEKYTIIVNLSQGTVEEIREGEGIEKGKKESGD